MHFDTCFSLKSLNVSQMQAWKGAFMQTSHLIHQDVFISYMGSRKRFNQSFAEIRHNEKGEQCWVRKNVSITISWFPLQVWANAIFGMKCVSFKVFLTVWRIPEIHQIYENILQAH